MYNVFSSVGILILAEQTNLFPCTELLSSSTLKRVKNTVTKCYKLWITKCVLLPEIIRLVKDEINLTLEHGLC